MQSEDLIYINIARAISQASYAERLKVGAIIVKNNNIIAYGYNGMPHGFDNKCEIMEKGLWATKPEVLHAESNAITKCAKSTNSSEGATLYSTTCPCFECAKLIIQASIIKVVYSDDYRLSEGLDLLIKARIEIKRI